MTKVGVNLWQHSEFKMFYEWEETTDCPYQDKKEEKRTNGC